MCINSLARWPTSTATRSVRGSPIGACCTARGIAPRSASPFVPRFPSIPLSPVAYALAISASFFTTLFLVGHRCDTCGLRMRARNLCCGLSQPGFETGLAESCVIAGNQRFLAEFRSRITSVWISDDFAGIFKRDQSPPDEFIHAKLLRASNFDDAVERLVYRDPAHRTRDIVGGHRLEKHMWQSHLFAVEGNVGKALEELEELRRLNDGVRDGRFSDQFLLSNLSPEITTFGQLLRPHNR